MRKVSGRQFAQFVPCYETEKIIYCKEKENRHESINQCIR
jgi:hypothetical protein